MFDTMPGFPQPGGADHGGTWSLIESGEYSAETMPHLYPHQGYSSGNHILEGND